MSPKVSVILPVFNAGLRLHDCLDRLVAQTLDDIEIVIVNDGSTDDSSAILKDFASRYPQKIKLIEQANGGASSARNVGLRAASGDWIYFCDADDIVDVDICRRLYNLAIDADADISSCALVREQSDGSLGPRRFSNCPISATEEIIRRDKLFNNWILPLFRLSEDVRNIAHGYLVLCLFKRSIIFKENIAFDTSLKVHEDEIFVLEYLNYASRAALTDATLYIYRHSETSACVSYFGASRDILKIESNRRILTRRRRLIWQKHFPNEGRGLAELYAAECFHSCLELCARHKNLFAKISDMSKLLLSLKSDAPYKTMKINSAFLPRKKRLFILIMEIGAFASVLFCKALLFMDSRK